MSPSVSTLSNFIFLLWSFVLVLGKFHFIALIGGQKTRVLNKKFGLVHLGNLGYWLWSFIQVINPNFGVFKTIT